MKRGYWASLISIVVIAASATAYVRSKDYVPQLGLDLKGGSSIVLQPVKDAKAETLDQAKEIIRNRVDALGVAEPDVHREGNSIIVQLPGVTDEARAEQLVGQTAKLTFRRVVGSVEPDLTNTSTSSTTTTTIKADTTKTSSDSSTPNASAEQSASGTTTTTASTTTTAPAPPAEPTTPREQSGENIAIILPANPKSPTGPRLSMEAPVLSGDDLRTASVAFNPDTAERYISLSFKGGQSTETLKTFSAANVGAQMAIVLDGRVESAPTIESAFTSSDIQITQPGGYGDKEARDLVNVLKYGSLPVELKTVSIDKISATLGRDSLRAGVIAGGFGLGLVLLYIIFYYRALGIVTVLGLTVSLGLLYSIISMLGHTNGLALSLSGVTGIIVSVGVTVDSYVVYFEKLKDEIRAGRSVKASVERGFKSAFRTILAADFSSLIGAAVLYYLSVGAVKGFAFFLGLSTLLDIFVAYFFTRPMVAILGRNRMFTEMRGLGIARGLAAKSGGGE